MGAFEFSAQPWEWSGPGARWVFVTVPEPIADEVDATMTGPDRGFGAVKVRITIGGTTWTTSMFPSREHASYILPLKAVVRRAESVAPGRRAWVRIELAQP